MHPLIWSRIIYLAKGIGTIETSCSEKAPDQLSIPNSLVLVLKDPECHLMPIDRQVLDLMASLAQCMDHLVIWTGQVNNHTVPLAWDLILWRDQVNSRSTNRDKDQIPWIVGLVSVLTPLCRDQACRDLSTTCKTDLLISSLDFCHQTWIQQMLLALNSQIRDQTPMEHLKMPIQHN